MNAINGCKYFKFKSLVSDGYNYYKLDLDPDGHFYYYSKFDNCWIVQIIKPHDLSHFIEIEESEIFTEFL